MAYRRFRRSRRSYRSSRRGYRVSSRRFKRRYRRSVRRGGINSTRSRTVRLSTQLTMAFTAGDAAQVQHPVPVCFTPTQLPGFIDYATTYSEFRILKAVCKVHLAVPGDEQEGAALSNQPYTYLRVASRSFIESSALLKTGAAGPATSGSNPIAITDLLAGNPLNISDVRQSRWQRQYYPSDIKNSITFKFYPYTLEWSGKPVGNYAVDAATAPYTAYLKYRSGRRWMPMSFIGRVPTENSQWDDVSFLGPYFLRLLSTEADTQALGQFRPVITLSVWAQFRGQK